jgi:hypothetical protein
LNLLEVAFDENSCFSSNFQRACAFASREFLPWGLGGMGIKQSCEQVLHVRQPTGGQDLAELAGSRAPPRTPQRQRGLWGFLVWQFVIAPIVAATSSLIGGGHALATEDQDGRAADHQKGQPDAASGHDQAAAGTPEDSRNDQTDASLRLHCAAPNGLSHDEHAWPAVAHHSDGTASLAGDSAAGDHLEAASSDDANAAPDSGIAVAAFSGEASSGSALEISQQIVIGEPASGGLSVDIGGELGLALATSDVVSTPTSSLADILATVGVSSSVDLKDYLGFDLHVSSGGEFVANDLGAALDFNASFAMSNTVGTAVGPANPVLSAVTLVADGLPILVASSPLDRLLAEDNHDHSVVGHLGDLTSVIPGGDPIAALVGNIGGTVLSSNSAASVGTSLGDLAGTSTGGEANTDLPFLGAVSDPAHVSIVVEAAAVMPGHSIEFPKPAPSEGDVLFHGNSYTDYHVALQSAGPSSGSGSTAPTPTCASGTADATPLTHVDTPVANAAPSASTGATAQHPDALLTHIATTLDDMSLHSHTH